MFLLMQCICKNVHEKPQYVCVCLFVFIQPPHEESKLSDSAATLPLQPVDKHTSPMAY